MNRPRWLNRGRLFLGEHQELTFLTFAMLNEARGRDRVNPPWMEVGLAR